MLVTGITNKSSTLKEKFEKWAVSFETDDYDGLKSDILRNQLDPNETLINGLKPLHIACILGNHNAVRFLLGYKIDIDSKSFVGKSPLDEALENKNFNCAIEILNKKPKTHIKFRKKSEFQSI